MLLSVACPTAALRPSPSFRPKEPNRESGHSLSGGDRVLYLFLVRHAKPTRSSLGCYVPAMLAKLGRVIVQLTEAAPAKLLTVIEIF
jgi:hypothetical protein